MPARTLYVRSDELPGAAGIFILGEAKSVVQEKGNIEIALLSGQRLLQGFIPPFPRVRVKSRT